MAGQRDFQSALRIFHCNASAGERLPIESHLQLRRRGVPVEIEIDDAWHCLERVLGLFQDAAHFCQVGPNTFSTTLPRTPATASSTLSFIGCEKL